MEFILLAVLSPITTMFITGLSVVFLPLTSRDKTYQALSHLTILEVTESWARPGNKAKLNSTSCHMAVTVADNVNQTHEYKQSQAVITATSRPLFLLGR